MNKIVFIGWGNVAQHLAQQFQTIHFEIVQVLTHRSKTPHPTVHSISELVTHADVYFIAVPDDQIHGIVEKLPQLNGLVLHCSGANGIEILARQHRYGVFYALQTFRKESHINLHGVPFFLESNSNSDLHLMQNWVNKWGGKAFQLDLEQRQKIHLAAVWAMNFSNAMYVISEKILMEIDIPFKILEPLLIQAQKNAFELGPQHAQTGPAIRKDHNLIQKHSQEMTDELEKSIYLAISKLIQENS